MATTADVISQSSSINLISRSISTTRSSLSSTNVTVGRIQKIIETKTKIRSDLFFKNQIIERRRREASKRREYEDQIEASKVTTNVQSGLRVASSSGQGPLSRILSFLGYLGAGWILENLPTWIAIGQEFIARMKKAGELIYSIPQTMWRIIQGFGTVLKSIGTNIINLDFTDSSGEVRDSFTQLTDTIELLGTQIVDGFKLVLQPSGEVDIPSTGEQQPDTGFPEVPTPSPGGGGTPGSGGKLQPIHYQALNIIAGPESGGDYNAMNNGKAGDRPGGSKKWLGKNLTDMTIGEIKQHQNTRKDLWAAGKYQFVPNTLPGVAASAGLKDKDLFDKNNQDLMAITLVQQRGIQPWTVGGSSYSAKEREIVEQARRTPLGKSTPTAPPRPVSTGTMNLIPQTGSGGFIQGGSGSGGDTTYATHFHIDAKTANPNAEQLANIREVSFQAVKAMFARGSWVHFGNIKKNVYSNVSDSELKSLIVAEQRAHGARSSAGVDIQEHNPKTKQTFPSQPGSATKFPFAVGEVYYRGGYGREAEVIGTGGITVSHGAAGSSASQVSPQLAKVPSETSITPTPSAESKQPQISSATPQQQRQVAEAVTQERMGQQFLFIDDRTVPQPSVSTVSQKSYGGGSSGQITEFDMLNNFMKQKLLLDFNYL